MPQQAFDCFISPVPALLKGTRPKIADCSPRSLPNRITVPPLRDHHFQRRISHPRRQHTTAIAADRVLWATDLTKTHDGRIYQFQSLSLTLPRGAKIALLGANGSGKSTLLNVLAGQVSPDSGVVEVRKNTSIALVSQELPASLDTSQTTTSAVLSLAASHTNSADVRAALRYASSSISGDLSELAKAAAEMDERPRAWEVESYLQTAMERLELPRDARVCDLSGGQKRRVGIAAALVSKPDVLLLDEVTNHLSIEGIQFLEEVLQDPSLSIICISHDRYFVDAVCSTAIWELDGDLHMHAPGYDAFLRDKSKRLVIEQKEMSDLAKAFRKELDWMRKQPKARATKAKARTDKFQQVEEELKRRKTKAKERGGVRGLAAGTAWLGTEVLELKDVTLKRGDRTIVKGLNYTFERGERVGVCGPNGVGKSSFLKALLGELPVQGDLRVGETVVFGYFDQDGLDLSTPLSEGSAAILGTKGDEIRVLDYVGELISLYGYKSADAKGSGRRVTHERAEDEVEAKLAAKIEALSHSAALSSSSSQSAGSGNILAQMTPIAILDHFGFQRQHQHTLVSRLSGGEKRRLQLIALLLKNPNFLILDEVSNDLDLNTITMLEELLLDYRGVLVLCSHDRFMLDRLVDHLLVLEGDGEVSFVEGKFTDYLEAKRVQEMAIRRVKKAEAKQVELNRVKGTETGSARKQRRLSYKESKEYARLETEIENCQKRHEQLSAKLEREATGAPYGDLAEWTAELARTEAEIEAKTERWIELAEIAGD